MGIFRFRTRGAGRGTFAAVVLVVRRHARVIGAGDEARGGHSHRAWPRPHRQHSSEQLACHRSDVPGGDAHPGSFWLSLTCLASWAADPSQGAEQQAPGAQGERQAKVSGECLAQEVCCHF